MPTYCREELSWYEHSWKQDGSEPNERQTYYELLYDAFTKGKPLPVTAEQVRLQLAVMEECVRQNPRFAP